jgi:hypothetical protein
MGLVLNAAAGWGSRLYPSVRRWFATATDITPVASGTDMHERDVSYTCPAREPLYGITAGSALLKALHMYSTYECYWPVYSCRQTTDPSSFCIGTHLS